MLALHLRGDAFTAQEKARDFAYYEARTVRDSSLSATTQGIVAAEVGHLELAHRYWAETAFTDLHDLHGNVDQGLHIAAMAGAWMMAVAGFGGMRDHDGTVTFAPRLPPRLSRLRFRMRCTGHLLEVEVRRRPGQGAAAQDGAAQQATYRLLEGRLLHTRHHGQQVELRADTPVTLPVPPPPEVAPVRQPPGREPARPMHTHD